MELDKKLEHIKDKHLYVILSKNKPCCDCGNKYHHSQMQFDHLPEYKKEISIGNGKQKSESLEKIKQEILKCDLICANCHFKRTFLRSIGKTKQDLLKDKKIEDLTNEQLIEIYKESEKIRKKEYRRKQKEIKNEKNK